MFRAVKQVSIYIPTTISNYCAVVGIYMVITLYFKFTFWTAFITTALFCCWNTYGDNIVF